MCDLIVSVPDHCLSFYFIPIHLAQLSRRFIGELVVSVDIHPPCGNESYFKPSWSHDQDGYLAHNMVKPEDNWPQRSPECQL